MTAWRMRDIHTDDLDGILHLYEQQRSSGVTPIYARAGVLTSASADVAVVATAQDGQIIGARVERVAHNEAWVVFHAVVTERHSQEVGSQMLRALEKRLADHGANVLSVLLPAEEVPPNAFRNAGYTEKKQLRYFERRVPVQRAQAKHLAALGGRILPRTCGTRSVECAARRKCSRSGS